MDRRALRRALRDAAPWLDEADVGPRAVDAGTCDRCGILPRLLPTCGPNAPDALCRRCAAEAGDDAWCEGHRDDGRAARAWADRLPDRWADTVLLWWVATGEVGWDATADMPKDDWPSPIAAALHGDRRPTR
jgi:hypothetical protein